MSNEGHRLRNGAVEVFRATRRDRGMVYTGNQQPEHEGYTQKTSSQNTKGRRTVGVLSMTSMENLKPQARSPLLTFRRGRSNLPNCRQGVCGAALCGRPFLVWQIRKLQRLAFPLAVDGS